MKTALFEWECILDPVSPYNITFKTLVPLPNRLQIPRKQQETTDNKTSALLLSLWNLVTTLGMVEA
jgi:hypothetical protein